MNVILVLVDRTGLAPESAELSSSVRELLTFARAAGEPVALIAGSAPQQILDQLGEYGATRALTAEQPELVAYSVTPKAELLAAAAKAVGASGVLVENTPEGKDIAGRAAVLLDAAVISDAVAVDAALAAEKSVLAGSYAVRAAAPQGSVVIAVKANSVQPQPVDAPSPVQAEPFQAEFSKAARGARVVKRVEQATTGRPDLASARTVVAGGRGVNGDFGPVEALADALGGAVGASRVATDSGWIDHSAQVGQTGRTVSPQLYISAGISGAIHHKAGMQTSKIIVAVNQDPEAPVFEIADFGIVGDLFQVLPQAAEEIKRRRG